MKNLLFNLGPRLAQIVTAVAACLGCMCSGTVLGYTSSAVPSLQDKSSSLRIDDNEAAWIGSLLPLGAVLGSLGGSPLLSIFGRRRSLLLVCAPGFALGWVLVGAAVHVAMLYVGRFIGGFSVGLAVTAAPIFVMETAQVALRGTLGALPQVMTTLGILVSYLLGAGLNWQWLAWASLVLVVPFGLTLLAAPESPVWLLEHRGSQEALEALTWLRGGDRQVAQQELTEMEANSSNESKPASESKSSEQLTPNASGLALLKQAPYLKAFMVVVGLMLFQQLSGVNSVIFYATKIFQETGSTIDPNVSTIMVGTVQFLTTVCAAALVERAGRKPLLAGSAFFMTASLAAMGTFFYLKEEQGSAPGWLPILSLGVFICAFSMGYGPLTWLVGAEILPFEIMAVANPLAVTLNWTCVFLVTFTFQGLQLAIHSYGAFWLYGAVALLSLPFSLFCVPETKGRSQEEIRRIFQGKSTPTYATDEESPPPYLEKF